MGAGAFFAPELHFFWFCMLTFDVTLESGAVIRLVICGIGPVILPEIFLTGRATEGLILLTWTVFSPFKNFGSRLRGTLVKGQLIPSIFGN